MKFDMFDWLAIILVIIGALNWGLLGLFGFDLVAVLFGGPMSLLTKIVYGIIGFAGAYIIYLILKLRKS